MPLPTKDSRAGAPLQLLDVDEQPTACIYCDTRTVPDAPSVYILLFGPGYSHKPREEHCPHCGQRYWVMDENEDD